MPDWLRRAWKQITGKSPATESSAPKPPSPATPRERWTVPGVYFDTSGWRLDQASPTSMTWTCDLGGVMTLTREATAAASTPRAINLELERRQYRARAAAAGGGLVSVEPVLMPGGCVGVEAILKRPEGRGFCFDATLSVAEDETEFSVRLTGKEVFTGIREAAVNAQMWQLGEITIEDLTRLPADWLTGAHPLPGLFADPYDPAFDADAVYRASDDSRLDALVPEHPLSVIRSTLRQVRTSWAFDAARAPRALVPEPTPESAGPRVMLSVAAFREIYWAHGRHDVLEPELQAAIAAVDSGGADPEVARLLLMLGLVQQNSGNALKARVALQRAVQILTIARGADHRETGIALALLGRTQMHLDRTLDAERSFRNAVAILEKSADAHVPLVHSLSQLGTLAYGRNNVQEGTSIALRVHELVTKTPISEDAMLLRELVGGPPAAGIARMRMVEVRG